MSIENVISKTRREILKGVSRELSLKSASVRFRGKKLRIPLVFGLGAEHLGPEAAAWPARFLEMILARKSQGAVVDIGANVGLYLLWLRSFDIHRPYVAFEPNPACYYYLHELIQLNGFSNTRIFPVALSTSRDLRTFYAKRHGDKMGSLLESHRRETDKPRSFDLLTDCGDEILGYARIEHVDFIKVDVEGSELEVLCGLEKTLQHFKPVVLCEILGPQPHHPDSDGRAGRIRTLLEFLSMLDYVLISVGPACRIRRCESPDDIDSEQEWDRILVHTDDHDWIVDSLQPILDAQMKSH